MDNNKNEKGIYKERKIYLIAALVLMLFLGIGYAYLQTLLNISGTTKISHNTWSIYWDTIHVTDGSVTGGQVTTEPTLSEDDTKVSFSVNLKQPGDFYEFTINAVNEGTIGAMITSTLKKVGESTTIPDYLNYSVTALDGVPIIDNQLLKANSSETYVIRVEYKKDITSTDLPETDQTLECTFSAYYVQADDTAKEIIYNNSETSFTIGESVPNGIPTYSKYTDVVTAAHPVFLKHIISNGIITESYVGFVYNGIIYYLQEGINNYENNKEILKEAFEEKDCNETNSIPGISNAYMCSQNTEFSHWYGGTNTNGDVMAHYEEYECYIVYNGEKQISYCGTNGIVG